MYQKINKKTVFEYLSGRSTPEQKIQIQNWLNNSNYNQELYFQWLEEWITENPKDTFDAQSGFKNLSAQIIESDRYESETHRRLHSIVSDRNAIKARKPVLQRWYQMAAVFLLLLAASSVYFFIQQTQTYITYQTAFGETKTIRLPDRSMVRLNSNSELKFLSEWDGKSTREVWITGEGFFSVVHTASDQKFVVHSNEVNVEVLGTEFNVNNRRKVTKVVLNSGKVRLNGQSESEEDIIMKPGELVELSDKSQLLTHKKVNIQLYTSWRNNELVFEKTSVNEIIQLLKDNYGLAITWREQDVQNQTFTATLPADNADVLLSALAKSFNLQMRKKGNQIIFERI